MISGYIPTYIEIALMVQSYHDVPSPMVFMKKRISEFSEEELFQLTREEITQLPEEERSILCKLLVKKLRDLHALHDFSLESSNP